MHCIAERAGERHRIACRSQYNGQSKHRQHFVGLPVRNIKFRLCIVAQRFFHIAYNPGNFHPRNVLFRSAAHL